MQYRQIFQQIESGNGIQSGEGYSMLKRRKKVMVARCADDDGKNVIVKVWRRTGLSGLAYRVFRKSTGARERQCLGMAAELFDHGARVLGYQKVYHSVFIYDEILICSDLGECEDAFEYLKSLCQADSRGMVEFENAIIDITSKMLAAGLVDIDHRLNNFLVLKNGSPVRIDFEHCKYYRQLPRNSREMGEMLGTLIGSRVFVTQPELSSVHDFCQRLMQRIRVDFEVLSVAQTIVDKMLAKQEDEIGVQVEFQIGPYDGC